MGLDMFLTATRYLWNTDGGNTEIAAAIENMLPELAPFKGQPWRDHIVNEIRIEAGYWRKANQIHRWFVENVQEGKDDCGTYTVSREALTELRDLCKRVLEWQHVAVEALPTQEGFFFGDTSYDEYYFKQLEQTVGIIDRCLSLPSSWMFNYSSSW